MGFPSSSRRSIQDDDEAERLLMAGQPNCDRCDNKIVTAKYTALSFLPMAIREQFRKFANVYFLCIGLIMVFGSYTGYFEVAMSPWTTMGPLGIVISVSLAVEGYTDIQRHRSDEETNNGECVILRRSRDIHKDDGAERDTSIIGGKDVIVNLSKNYLSRSSNRKPSINGGADPQHEQFKSKQQKQQPSKQSNHLVHVAFQKIKRKNIRQGHIILIRNREAVPADTIILASSGENGCAYIETSSIDGETNLKLRNSPTIPSTDASLLVSREPKNDTNVDTNNTTTALPDATRSTNHSTTNGYDYDYDYGCDAQDDIDIDNDNDNDEENTYQSLEKATKKFTQLSALAYPNGLPAIVGSNNTRSDLERRESSKRRFLERKGSYNEDTTTKNSCNEQPYVATLTSEPPNSNVNTFSGKLTLPMGGEFVEIPLDAENILLRGAILRNTEWVLGFSCFTGKDTKLIRNSFQTPSKFSRIDVLINKYVVLIIASMCVCILYLSVKAVFTTRDRFNELWYVGYNHDSDQTWPYLPKELPPPKWVNTTNNILQNFLMFVTLLSNFVPLSMYVTLEMVNFFCLWLVQVDRNMYDPNTDTRAIARSTNVTDLGQVQYIFSDKTGTLTQNVMRFKRCSVDGMIFGAPVQKVRPRDDSDTDATTHDGVDEKSSGPKPLAFHPKRQLVVGEISVKSDGNEVEVVNQGGMTFNAEMFVRVMTLCHTVVVERELDNSDNIEESKSVSSHGSAWIKKKFFQGGKRGRTTTDLSSTTANALETVLEEPVAKFSLDFGDRGISGSSLESETRGASGSSSITPTDKGQDGAPAGFAYQAESPDENALVSEASKTFGFQVVGRNSSGITLQCEHPTVLSDEQVVSGLRNGSIGPKSLVSNYATGTIRVGKNETEENLMYAKPFRLETWKILAINKFDSERKRMSILLRAPPELGSVVILFCKGADSAMLDSNVYTDPERSHRLEASFDENDDDDSKLETDQMFRLQSHLGEFASEGLRTLVLGIRFLGDAECNEWLEKHKKAASSLKDRDALLRDAAVEIEKDLHIVGATAVEDKLQKGVPDTIATLEKAGIKLWVLTGDKRETAIEIGYSTKVLTPRIHLTEVADQGIEFVRAQCAMEFMRLVKAGKLPLYQRVAIDQSDHSCLEQTAVFAIRKMWRLFLQSCKSVILSLLIGLRRTLGFSSKSQEKEMGSLKEGQQEEKERLKDNVRRRNVRNRAEAIIEEYKRKHLKSSTMNASLPPGSDIDNYNLSNDELPTVFNRAQSAKSALEMRDSSMRSIRISQLTAQEVAQNTGQTPLEEDLLSLKSMCVTDCDTNTRFDKKRRTVLEKLFAVDHDVRKGRLLKHKKKGQLGADSLITPSGEGPRALIIEGNALKHLLGDNELEELLFNIASQCDAVIACRVSPKQKALLVKLVRHHVVPQPVTLAIGDGANDVGMIQEAHVGIGISGLEGKQAVNASDFAIAQFRFLETLLLVHGRWDFMRQATVVLFSFYKNAVMSGCLIVYCGSTLYSGQPLFDQWVLAVFNFMVFFPIYFLGIFDRCLEKDYVLKHPEMYKTTRQNEVLTMRILFRWIFMTVCHTMILYHGSFYYLSGGGGNSSSYSGLMRYHDRVGDGEGSDVQSVGLVIYSSMVLLLAYKVLYESRTIINGKWPAFACWKGATEGYWSRVPYSWYGVLIGSLSFYFLFHLPIYELITTFAEPKFGGFFNLHGVVPHVFLSCSTNYVSMLFVPIAGIAFDVCLKAFSNMYYPTQTQIHVEIQSKDFAKRKAARRRNNHAHTNADANMNTHQSSNGDPNSWRM